MRRWMTFVVLGSVMVPSVIACSEAPVDDPDAVTSSGSGVPAEFTCPPGTRELDDGSCLAAGTQPDGCEAGELADEAGDCRPAGVQPGDCGAGFVHDGDAGCEPILPAEPCGPGEYAVPGDRACRDFSDCWDTWPDVSGDVVYVDATAQGMQNGTQAAPYDSLAKGVANAPGGATLLVAAGSYDTSVEIDQTLTVWGSCADRVTLVSSGTDAAVTFMAGSDDSVLRGVAITGGGGVRIEDAADVSVQEVRAHALAGYAIVAERLTAPTSVTVTDSSIEGATGRGVYTVSASTTLERVSIRDMVEDDGKMGRAIDTDVHELANSVSARSVYVAGGIEVAVLAHATHLEIHDSLIRDTLPRSDGRFGRALSVQSDAAHEPSSLRMTGSVVDGARDAGLFATAADVEVERTVVRNIDVNLDARWRGYGLVSSGATFAPTRVFARRSLIDSASEAGVANLGAEVELESVVVRDTRPVIDAIAEGYPPVFAGRGITTQVDYIKDLAGPTVVRGCLVERNHEAGIAAVGAELFVAGTLVRDQLPTGDFFGRGILVQHVPDDVTPSNAVVVDSVMRDNHEAGFSVVASTFEADGILVSGTLPNANGLAMGASVEIAAETLVHAWADIHNARFEGHRTASVFVVGADAQLTHSHVDATDASPVGGYFGDGVIVMSEIDVASMAVVDSLVSQSTRAGIASFGAIVGIEQSTVDCAAFALAAEEHDGLPPEMHDLGGNACGCGEVFATCKAASSSLAAPDPPPSL